MRRDGKFFITRKLAHLKANKGAQGGREFPELHFPSDDLSILVFMMGTFFVSGIVKGFLGIGLPAAAMALLALVVSPTMRFLFWSYRSCLPTCPSSHDPNIARNPLNPIGFWEPPFWSTFLSPRFYRVVSDSLYNNLNRCGHDHCRAKRADRV